MKIAGIALILLSSMMIGRWKAWTLSRRAFLIERSLSMLRAMSERLRYLRPSMRQLLRALVPQYPELFYLEGCAQEMEGGSSFSDAWKHAVQDMRGMEAGEREILLSLGDTLGCADLDSQIAAIACACALLEEKYAHAREESLSHGKLYRSLGALAGLAIAVILY